MKRFSGVKGQFTTANLPRINPFRIIGLKRQIVGLLNRVPPFPYLYTGRDRTVPEKESVLHPKFPPDTVLPRH